MKVVNKTRNTVLSENAGLASSFFTRMIGLMFSKDKDLVIKASREGVLESSIHMMFMRQPIDVIWVDGGRKVVGVEKKVRPHDVRKPDTWKVYKPESRPFTLSNSKKEAPEGLKQATRLILLDDAPLFQYITDTYAEQHG